MGKLTNRRLVAILKKVPEKRLRISELAPGLLTEDRKVDIEKCMEQQDELNLAISEVKSYIGGVNELRHALSYIGRKVERELYEEEDIDVGEEDGL